MSAHDRPTFLYKLETACQDLLAPNSNADASSVLRDHFDYLKRFHEQGDIVLFGLTLNPDPLAVGFCVFHALSEAAARSIMENDPLIAKGLAQGTLYPFYIALQGPCLA
ncbi:MAG TPA: YciI family protein [Candidatus Sulfotelmatobacter sp.]|jgi:uncharacterized protein YciI|nr:YciI family protein [Candidatus Sulfotelmatobacter sp.]